MSSSFNQTIIDEFRANDGMVTTAGFGRGLVLLHHVGAKSGQQRISPLMSIRPDHDTWLIAASKAGAPDNPAWFHNLQAHPDVTIEVAGGDVVPVTADVLTGDERDAAWARFTSLSKAFQEYQEATDRVIPVVALHRRAD